MRNPMFERIKKNSNVWKDNNNWNGRKDKIRILLLRMVR